MLKEEERFLFLKNSPDSVDLCTPLRRLWSNPETAVISEWFLDDERLPPELKFAEIVWRNDLEMLLTPYEICTRNLSYESAGAVTAEIWNLKCKYSAFPILYIVNSHGGFFLIESTNHLSPFP